MSEKLTCIICTAKVLFNKSSDYTCGCESNSLPELVTATTANFLSTPQQVQRYASYDLTPWETMSYTPHKLLGMCAFLNDFHDFGFVAVVARLVYF